MPGLDLQLVLHRNASNLTNRSRMSSATLTNNQPTTANQQKLIGVFLVVGLLMRCSRYLMNFPLWEDECFLAVNFIDRGYLELLEPLRYHQVAPVLFLWIELTAVKLFGFHEFALRAFPFLCSIVGLFLFLHLARRLLSGSALVLAVGIFAVSYPNMRYAAEAKQYASDMLAGLIYLTMCVECGVRFPRLTQLRHIVQVVGCGRWSSSHLLPLGFPIRLCFPPERLACLC